MQNRLFKGLLLNTDSWMNSFIIRFTRIRFYDIEITPYILSRISQNGYDVGYKKDQFGCNLRTCKCDHFDQKTIGTVLQNGVTYNVSLFDCFMKLNLHVSRLKSLIRRHYIVSKNCWKINANK